MQKRSNVLKKGGEERVQEMMEKKRIIMIINKNMKSTVENDKKHK